jgi:3-hydroxybutyryl-CoA dehydratase
MNAAEGGADRRRRLAAGEYWFEDLTTGDWFETGAVNVTEAHVVTFAGLAGDLFDVHMDDEFARSQGFPGRIAHGLLGLALVDGLKTRCATRIMAVAALNWNLDFRAPIRIGDRIRARFEVLDARLTKRGDRGILRFRVEVSNQDRELVQSGEHKLMVRCRTAST